MAAAAGFREIEHTADVGFEAWAGDLPGVFEQATLALAQLCYDRAAVQPRQRRTLSVVGNSNEHLLVRWLQEVYLQLELEAWLTAGVEALQVGDGMVTATLVGEPCDRRRHTLYTEIKAITYHQLRVARDQAGVWSARVIIDV